MTTIIKYIKYLPTFITVFSLTLLFACGPENSNIIETSTVSDQPLSIDTFSTFPNEINGCSCYFSNDSIEFKKGEYIYMNDFAETSFLKINGVLTKFTQTDFIEVNKANTKAKYKSGNYEMTIEVKNGKESGDETMLKSGTIILTDKNGKSVTKVFYGECGC